MFTYKKLIKLNGPSCSTIYDKHYLMSDVLDNSSSSTFFVVHLTDPSDKIYAVNVSKILVNHTLPASVVTIEDFVSNWMTMEMLTAYHNPSFSLTHKVQYIQIEDIGTSTDIKAYSLINEDTSDIFDSPTYPDILITNSFLNINQVCPVIGGKVQFPVLQSGGVVVKDGISVLRETTLDAFLYIPKQISVIRLRDLTDMVLPHQEFLLVLDGRLIPPTAGLYRVSVYNKLMLNHVLISNKEYFSSYADVVASDNSFVILFDGNFVADEKKEDLYEDTFVFKHYDDERHIVPSHTLCFSKDYLLKKMCCMKDRFTFRILPRTFKHDEMYIDDSNHHELHVIYV